jgi:hypothetical protein
MVCYRERIDQRSVDIKRDCSSHTYFPLGR